MKNLLTFLSLCLLTSCASLRGQFSYPGPYNEGDPWVEVVVRHYPAFCGWAGMMCWTYDKVAYIHNPKHFPVTVNMDCTFDVYWNVYVPALTSQAVLLNKQDRACKNLGWLPATPQ